jgi:hypothetical protein
MPFRLAEVRATMVPRNIDLPPVKDGKVESFIIRDAKVYRYIDHATGSIPQFQDAFEYAQAVCTDFIEAEPFKTAYGWPALFAVDGIFRKEEVAEKLKDKIDEAVKRQTRWFTELVKQADDVWERTRQHRAIPDTHRLAAQFIKAERAWVVKSPEDFVKCSACFNVVDARAVICSFCKLILKPEEAAKLKFAS